MSYNYEQNKTGQIAGGIAIGNLSNSPAPMRESGFQMRILECLKIIEDAHQCLGRIEHAMGGALSTPDTNAKLGVPPGPMNLDRVTGDLRVKCGDLAQRLNRIEEQF